MNADNDIIKNIEDHNDSNIYNKYNVIDELKNNISYIFISSPAPSNPTIDMIKLSINSLYKLSPFDTIEDYDILKLNNIIIMLDGYILINEDIQQQVKLKQGRISKSMEDKYNEFEINLRNYYKSYNNIEIIRLNKHYGFGLAVKEGLLRCKTKYAFICQHDRIFIKEFKYTYNLIKIFEKYSHIRYMGFATSSSKTHADILHSKYNLSFLNNNKVDLDINDNEYNIYLQPLIFWFDSQHVCNVKRYLEIYKPYLNMPNELKDLFTSLNDSTISYKDAYIREGDFIEDRFGQMQRRLLSNLKLNDISDEIIYNSFLWYGSYLIYSINKNNTTEIYTDNKNILFSSNVYVNHLRGRLRSQDKANYWRRKNNLEVRSIFYQFNVDHNNDHENEILLNENDVSFK